MDQNILVLMPLRAFIDSDEVWASGALGQGWVS